MSFAPLFAEPWPILIHALAAMAAFVLGVGQFVLPKGTGPHVWMGRAWVLLMAVVALSSFLIFEIRTFGPFSPLHLLAVLTLTGLWRAVTAARRGDIATHKRIMTILFVAALLVAGGFTLLPGRVMHQVVFGG